jgi:hypothetical protein
MLTSSCRCCCCCCYLQVFPQLYLPVMEESNARVLRPHRKYLPTPRCEQHHKCACAAKLLVDNRASVVRVVVRNLLYLATWQNWVSQGLWHAFVQSRRYTCVVAQLHDAQDEDTCPATNNPHACTARSSSMAAYLYRSCCTCLCSCCCVPAAGSCTGGVCRS